MNTRVMGLVAMTVLGLTAAGPQAAADDVKIKLSAGIERSGGEYGGTDSVEDLYMPLSAAFDFKRVGFRVTVPYLSVTAPEGTIIVDPDGQPIPGTGPDKTEAGLGDITASFTVFDVLYSSEHKIAFDLSGKVKFGTADWEKGLGTGENDYSLQGDLYKFFDRYILVGTAGYRFRGDPNGVDLENALYGSAGAICKCAPKTRIGLFYDYRQSAVSDGDDIRELTGFLSQRLSKSFQLQVYAFTGLTDSAPDWGGGIMLKYEAT